MEIEFEIGEDKKFIKIIGIHKDERKVIGRIFTPSGSSLDTSNAIQICGFSEAFDLWGCSEFATYKTDEDGATYARRKPQSFHFPTSIFNAFDQNTRNKIIELFRQQNIELMDRTEKERIPVHLKDIQLKFPYPSESLVARELGSMRDCCWRCYNPKEDCECENKRRHECPFDVKRESDLILEKVKK